MVGIRKEGGEIANEIEQFISQSNRDDGYHS